MELVTTRRRTELHVVAAGISLGMVFSEPRRTVERLMNVAHQMLQPRDVVRLDAVFLRSANRCCKKRYFRLGVRHFRIVPVGSGRERLVNIVPVLVHRLVSIADVLRGFGSGGRSLAMVGTIQRISWAVAGVLDAVRPG